MITPKKKILFVSHDATRTGAPIVLLHLLEWLKKDNAYKISIFLKDRGELEDQFKAIADTYLPVRHGRIKRLYLKIANKFFSHRDPYTLPKALQKNSFDLIYLNTVDALRIVQVLKGKFACPVICHVHENEFSLMFNFPDSLSRENIACVDHFIAVSQSTRNNLIDNYKIAPEKISLAYEFIPLDKIKASTISKEEARKELGLKEEFIIGGAGASIWRKGVDLFIQLGVVLNKIAPDNNIKLLWVGFQDYESECQFKYESKRYGVQNKVLFVGKKEIPQNYFQLFDVFALTSREDPFPLVAIEAASLQKPIICFKDSGGIPELISDSKGGICVNYGDVEEMAKAILYLKEQNSARIKMGEEAAKLTLDYDVNVISKEIKQTISMFVEEA